MARARTKAVDRADGRTRAKVRLRIWIGLGPELRLWIELMTRAKVRLRIWIGPLGPRLG